MLPSMTKALNGQNYPKQNFLFATFQSYLENIVCLNACFPLFSNPFFISNFIRTASFELRFHNLNISGGSDYIWKRSNIFLQLFYFGLFKTFFRLLTKCVKPICKLLFPKWLVVLRKGCTWEKGEGKFQVWTYFIIHFTLCLIFIRVCPIEDPPFETREITRIIYFICCSVYTLINIFIENSGYINNSIWSYMKLNQWSYIYIYIYIYINIYIYIDR